MPGGILDVEAYKEVYIHVSYVILFPLSSIHKDLQAS